MSVLDGVARLAVLRALRLGDMLTAVPALRALRAALPHAHVTLIGLPWAAAFATRFRHYIDAFEAYPGWPGLPEQTPRLDAIPAFLARMQQARFDLVLQMQGSGTISNPAALLLGGRHTAGLYVPGGFCPDPSRFFPADEGEHEVVRLLRLVTSLGAPAQGTHLEFPLEPADRAPLAELAEVADLRPGRYVCVHAGASNPDKCWPAAHFARAADHLAARGFEVVLTGMPAELPITRAVAAAMRHAPRDVAGASLGLGPLGVLLADAALLVSNDTGVAHLATALEVPSVIVFSAAAPSRWRPLDEARHRVLGGAQATVDEVVAAAEELLAVGARPSAPTT